MQSAILKAITPLKLFFDMGNSFFLDTKSNDLKSQCNSVLKALANEDKLFPIQMFHRLPARATFVADANFVSGIRTQKMFLILFRKILCPQQIFPSLRNPRNIMGKNVSATMCPRLPGPLRCNIEVVFRSSVH